MGSGDSGGWYGRADSFPGSQSPLWMNPSGHHNQHHHHQHHVYSTDDDDVYCGQSVMSVGWKDVEAIGVGQPGSVVVGPLLHASSLHQLPSQQPQVQLQPRSSSRTSVYSTTSSSDRDSTSQSMEPKQRNQLPMQNSSLNPLLLVSDYN